MSLLDDFTRRMLVLAAANDFANGAAVVAVSGGPDSVALLDLLVRSASTHRLSLIVAHADHGIHPESARVAAQVAAIAEGYGLPLELGRLMLGPDAGETIARERRYAWLESVRLAQGASVILTGHHADDQIETVAMRFLRGSGPAGLAGMADRSSTIVRPLLPFRREELARYVHERGLSVWTDPANTDPRHLRSWLRGVLLPQVEARLPDFGERLQQVSDQARLSRRAWDAVLDRLPELDVRHDDDAFSVAAAPLAGYDSALGIAIVGALGRRAGHSIGPRRARSVFGLVRTGGSGNSVPLGADWRAELAFGRLRLVGPGTRAEPAALAGAAGEIAWGRWWVRWARDAAPAVQERRGMQAWVGGAHGLVIRPPAAGDRLVPLGGTGSRLLVRCFQDARIPRSRREGWPVVEAAGEIAWVPGVCRAATHLPLEGAEAVRVDVAYA